MARKARTPVVDRNRQLARIHAGKKALQLDDDTYRALLERVTGKRSSADMTGIEREAVIAELVRQGFQTEFAGKPRTMTPMLRKVEALLADGKKPWAYAHAIAKRMFAREKLEWLRQDEMHKLVAALQADANRKNRCEA